MDGARLFVAQEQTGVSIKKYVKEFDSVYIDFCKSLGAPMGAVLAGSKEFIKDIWFYKFQFGGYMHKAGILAAACIYGLENNLRLISVVLENTLKLAQYLHKLPFIEVELKTVETNIILLNITHRNLTAIDFEKELAKRGVRVHVFDKDKIRIVMHFDIGLAEIEYIKNAFTEIATKINKHELK
jgi:threonine aldolase